MNPRSLSLWTATLLVTGSMAITGCEKSEKNNDKIIHELVENRETYEVVSDIGDHHENRTHSPASGGHMQHMNKIRDWLVKELGNKYDEPLPPATQEQLVLGEKTYLTMCTSCHGEGGRGDGPASVALGKKPANFVDAAHSTTYSDQGRIYIIQKGIAGTPMAGWESILNKEEILSVYTYIRSLRSDKNEEGHEHDSREH